MMIEANNANHMSDAVGDDPAESAACVWNVVHRNAPGAINAIAFTVRPVSPRVGRGPSVAGGELSAIPSSFLVICTNRYLARARRPCPPCPAACRRREDALAPYRATLRPGTRRR